ncbi:MAG TPA: hypothetical protein VJS47_05810 [Rhizomicrobium sp.]|nr:hypothetical protein [Rhizomicrobium sp.]
MRAELPWNVAGIPPEAREAARAAARREGLSVGEWLTRRILHSFSAMDEESAAASYEHRAPPSPPLDSWGLPLSAASHRDTEEMMARVGRSESESNEAWRRIEDQLRGLGRRLDSNERSHSESNRVLSRTAHEMNINAREQAHAFQQLGQNVVSLSQRLERLERGANNESIKDAIRALHQGLSRLADQIRSTATNSATQVVQFTDNLEKLAGRLGEVRADSEYADQVLEERIDSTGRALDQRIGAMERSVETRLAAAEKTTQFNTNALDHALEKIEVITNQRTSDQAESKQRTAQQEEDIRKLENSFAQMQSQLPDPEHRLDTIERALSGVVARLEQPGLDTALKALSQRLEMLEKDHAALLAELQAAELQDKAPEPAQPPAPQTAFSPAPDMAIDPPAQPQQDDVTPAPDTELESEPAPAFDDIFTDKPADSDADTGEENFLVKARRSAREAQQAAEEEGRGRLNDFRRTQNVVENAETNRPRYLIPLIVALIVVLAAAAALFFSQQAQVPAPLPEKSAAAVNHPVAIPVPPPKPQAVDNQQQALPPADSQADIVSGGTEDFSTLRSEPGATDLPPAASSASSVAAAAKPVLVTPPAPPPSVSTSSASAVQHNTANAMAKPVVAPPSPAPAKPASPAKASSAPGPADRVTVLANAGNPVAQTILGLRALEGSNGAAVNLPDAVKFLTQAAEKGQAVAQYRLGTLYERGQGVATDPAKAMHWYGLAANQGNRKAMHNLAVAFAGGAAGKKNMTEAARWFAKAAALGLTDSQFNLAVLYERGDGVPQSLAEAYKWYAIAAGGGDGESKARAGILQTQLSEADRTVAVKAVAGFRAVPLSRSANVPPEPADLGI